MHKEFQTKGISRSSSSPEFGMPLNHVGIRTLIQGTCLAQELLRNLSVDLELPYLPSASAEAYLSLKQVVAVGGSWMVPQDCSLFMSGFLLAEL